LYGVNLHALAALLVGRFRQSKRLASELMDTIYGIVIPPSSICDMEKRTSAALAEPVEEVRQHLARAPVVHADETSWRRAKRKAWLWLVATPSVAYFQVDRHRSGAVIRGILGEDYGGTVVVDRWSAYKRLKRAFCWAHLRRDFRAMHERFHSEWHGVRLENAALQVLHIHRDWREGSLSRTQMLDRIAPLRTSIDRWLAQAAKSAPGSKAQKLAKEIGRHPDHLWRFLTDERIPPTNNFAERLIRPSVIVRSLSQGNDTVQGAVFTGRILTTIQTLRLQDRNVMAYLVDALTCHDAGVPMPSLLPLQTDAA
jgi:transposase